MDTQAKIQIEKETEGLSNPDPRVRLQAVRDLTRIARGLPLDDREGIVRRLEQVANDPEAFVRWNVAISLGQIAPPVGVSILEKMATDAHANVRFLVALALGLIGEKSGLAILERGILNRWGLAFILSFLILFPQPAYAHPDFPIAETVVDVPPGGFVEFPLSIHFHRVVGTFEVTSPAGGTITALLMDDDAFTRYAAGQPSSPLYSSGRTDRGKLNYVIACCRIVLLSREYRQDLTYTPYHLVLDNTGSPSSVTVRIRANLLHDGMAVIVHVAEPFGIIPMIGFFGAIGVGMSVFMRRKIRAATPSSASEAREGPKLLLLSLGSLASFVVLSLVVVSLGIAGMRSYGGNLIDGLILYQKLGLDTPSAERYVQVLIILSWLLAFLFWLGAFRAAVNRGSRLAGMIGIGEGLGWLGFWLLVAVNYGSFFVPAVLAALISLPQSLGGLYLIPKGQRIVAKS